MTTLFSKHDVLELLPYKHLIEAVESAHIGLAEGRVVHPERSTAAVPGLDTVVVPMLAISADNALAVSKILVDQPDDPAAPRQRSTIVAVDLRSGDCAALVDGAAVTRLRTAATTAVAARAITPPDYHTQGKIGAGQQAVAHLEAISEVRDLTELVIWNRTPERADHVVAKAREMGLEAHRLDHPRAVVERSDILCTLTPAVDPLVHAADLHPGLHINAVGSPPRPDYRELASDVLGSARVIVDSAPVARAESGAVQAAFRDGTLDPTTPLVDLGEVLSGRAPGRADAQEVTVFVSVGLGIQDLAAVTLMLDTAAQRGAGHAVADRLRG